MMTTPSLTFRIGTPLQAIEDAVILAALEHCGQNRTHAAAIINVPLRTLRYKLKSMRMRGIAILPALEGAPKKSCD